MLVLTRISGKGSVQIGENINIRILDTKGKQVRLGITAPKDIPVHREEIYNALKAEKNVRSFAKD